VACCELLERGPGRQPTVVAPKGSLTIERLAELGRGRRWPGQHLRAAAAVLFLNVREWLRD
jgi:hypothetical protein